MTDTMAGEALRKASSLCDEYRRAATGDGDPEKTLWAVDALIDQASEALAAQPSAGAQGEAETLRVLLDNLVISQSLSRALREKATDDARSYLYDLRQKPSGHTSKCWGRTSYSDEVVHCYCATPAQPDTSLHNPASDLDPFTRAEVSSASGVRVDKDPQPDTGDVAALREAGREAIWKVVHEVWQLLDDGETDSAGVTEVDQERLRAVSEAMDTLEALVPDAAGPFWGGFPVNYFWGLAAAPPEQKA